MSLSSLTSVQLQRLIQLVKEKEAIQAKLDQVGRALVALEGGRAAVGTVRVKRAYRRRRRKALKDSLLEQLGAAGKKGMSVKDLAASLNANPASVSVWFYTTGKKTRGIKKLRAGRYAYDA